MENSITVDAKVENVPVVTEFVDRLLEANDCSMKAQMQIDIAIDELFSNIAYYAYPEKNGTATINVDFSDDKKVKVTFIDSGIPYNPLEKEDPDVTLKLEDRQIGGLGIFMVKKSMDDISYEYKDDQNILTIIKSI